MKLSGLKILIACKEVTNPYLDHLKSGLENREEVDRVDYGLAFLDSDEIYDVLLLQWPEAIINFEPADSENVKYVENVVNIHKARGAKIISTVHNLLPHNDITEYTRKLYEVVYKNSDAIIHLGEASKSLLSRQIVSLQKDTKQFVISHGNYAKLYQKINQNDARKKLGLKSKGKIILVLGHVRNKNELKLVHKVTKAASFYNHKILWAGRLYSRRQLKYYYARIKLFITPNLIFHHGVIKDDDIKYYMNSADILFIARVNSLNSGNVALGMTFGKLIIGPDYGVIGEMLERTQNVTFSDSSIEVIRNCIEKSISLLETTSVSDDNFKYAQEKLNWDIISSQYINVFKDVSGNPKEQKDISQNQNC